jgi:hypothetical protein
LSINDDHSRFNDDNSALDAVIEEIKKEFKTLLAKRKELIIKLGEAFERTVSNSESICEEIKITLAEEIEHKLISTRDIERYCPEKWKKKTRPKKERIDNLSISRQEQQDIPQLLVDTDGNTVTEPAATSDKDIVNHEEFIKEPKCAYEFPAHNELDNIQKESANVDQRLLSEQDRVKELATKVERLEIDLQSKFNENIQLKSQVEGLNSRLEAHSHNQQDKNFHVKFQVSFEDLRRHMNSCYKKNIGIAEVAFTAKVNLAKREITEIQIVGAESLESTN